MDWTLAIEKNREALMRILAMLVAMVAVAGDRVDLRAHGDAGIAHRPATLPRHLHRFVLRLLRPAETAARRLIIVAARGLVVELSPPRIVKPKPQSFIVRSWLGIAITPAPGQALDRVLVPSSPARPRSLSLPLFDPLKRWGGRQLVKQRSVPRISFFDSIDRPRQPNSPPLSPDDPLDAGRLHRRLEALASALNNLPRAAKRLARWRARLDAQSKSDNAASLRDIDASSTAAGAQNKSHAQHASRIRRLEPMRPGRPPGWRRQPAHAVDEILNELHGLAVLARECPDTS